MASRAPSVDQSASRKGSAAITLKVVAAGAGGVEEMSGSLNDDAIQFGILKFAFGQGTFQRIKLIFVHFNGENVSGVKKGKVNAKKGSVIQLCGTTHAEYLMESKADCSVDAIFTKMEKIFVSDDKQNFSIASMKADYERMIAEAKLRAMEMASGPKRKTAAEMGIDISGERALKAVREPMGPFNWVLLIPNASKLEFVNAGSLSVDEMSEWLKPDQVYYGLLRMGFGSGKFRRTKWISIWWSGESVSAVKRGKFGALEGDMMKRVEPFSLTVSARNPDEITLKAVIDKVRRATVVDGDEVGASEDPFSMEQFMLALKEEMEANKDFFGDVGTAQRERDFETTLKEIRENNGPLTWGLFEIAE
eukprot:m.105796 g.105796  ORF g.105796 m.105796 type:complete len:363 (-) comp51660_c0_seq1:149-1237(-)